MRRADALKGLVLVLVLAAWIGCCVAVEGPRPVSLARLMQINPPAPASSGPGGIMGFLSSYWHYILVGVLIFRMIG